MSHSIVKQMTFKSSIHISISSLSVTLHKPNHKGSGRHRDTEDHTKLAHPWWSHCQRKTMENPKESQQAPSHWNHRSRKPLQWFWRHCLFWRQRNMAIANSLAKGRLFGPDIFPKQTPPHQNCFSPCGGRSGRKDPRNFMCPKTYTLGGHWSSFRPRWNDVEFLNCWGCETSPPPRRWGGVLLC